MENASKALIMAAGVLLGIMILSLLVYTFSQAGDFYRDQNKKQADKQLQQFNAQFEAFNKKGLLATDIATLINKAKENNVNYDLVTGSGSNPYAPKAGATSSPYYIAINFQLSDAGKNNLANSYTLSNGSAEDFISNFNGYKFKCGKLNGNVGIEYNSEGRVSALTFITE